MGPLEFADRFLQPYKTNGDELIPTKCPYCHGGEHNDKNSFALNVEKKTYKCLRGKCGMEGHFSQLCKDFGVEADRDGSYIPSKKKKYKKPEHKPQTMRSEVDTYLRLRGFSTTTIEAYKIGTDDNGNILFPYYDDHDVHKFNKFRYPRKLKDGERKAWREADTEPILFGMHLCDTQKPLTIFEGEFDAMAGYEAGIPNCVSVPSGAQDFTWLDTCWDFVQKFDSIYIYGDNDEPGREMVRKLSIKLGNKKVYVVKHEYKDANEELHRRGTKGVLRCWEMAEEHMPAGLIRLAEVTPLDTSSIKRVKTSITPLNKMLGGFMMGDITIFTGKRGEGKSTLLSMLMLDAIESGERVCAYSGELRADRFQLWTDFQAAGERNISDRYDSVMDRQTFYVPRAIRDKIHEWYFDRYFMYDNTVCETNQEEVTILQVFENAAKRYDCSVFLVDNLMTADYGRMSDSDFYRQQSRFVGQLVAFAKKFNVHVWLVAHPRKTIGKLGNDDISGSGDISNRADNVLTLGKVTSEDDSESGLCDLLLRVTKNRWEGTTGTIRLNYSQVDHRLYAPDKGNDKQYGWEKCGEDKEFVELDPATPVPW